MRDNPICIICKKEFEEKEGFVVAKQYDTGICIDCQKKFR